MALNSFPHYLQLDSMDCGPACLKMIAKYYGKTYSLENLRERCFITREGVSLLGISDAAESIGMRTIGVKTSFENNEKDVVTAMAWKKKDGKEQFRANIEGKYLVQTTLKGCSEQQIWSYYNVIRRVESVFECLKSDLDSRPVYHQNDEAVKAHFHLAILAYWIVSTAQYQLRQQGVNHTWREIRRIASTQVVVSTTATRCDGNRTEIRQCTEPEEQLAELYRLLKLKNPPIKRTLKICVVHSEEILKNDT